MANDIQVNIRLTSDIKEKLDEHVEELRQQTGCHLGRSEVIRSIIEKFLVDRTKSKGMRKKAA
jgi:metal-responsive CopG/Arc/MetJ family transcriptional regulator